MNSQETYITLAAIQGELQSTASDVFGMFCIEHKDNGGSRNARQAFANILKKANANNNNSDANNKDLENLLETMKYGFVKNRIYDTNGDGDMVLRDEINLKILDSFFLYDCLKNMKGFPTFQEKLQRRRRLKSCKQALHQQCCLACNHKCSVCEKKECKDDKCHPGLKCNQHPCRNCDEIKEVCLISSSVCCKKCATCFYCGSKLKFDITDRCDRLRLICGLDILLKFRVLFEKLTFEDCDLLLKGLHTLPGFPLCRSFGELGDYLLNAYNEVLGYLSKQENFTRQQVIPVKEVEHKLNTISAIFKVADADQLLYTQQDDVIKTLGFVNEACSEPSKEYHYVMKRIEELKTDERFQRQRSEVLLDRKPSNTKNVNGNLESVTSTTTALNVVVKDGKVKDKRKLSQEECIGTSDLELKKMIAKDGDRKRVASEETVLAAEDEEEMRGASDNRSLAKDNILEDEDETDVGNNLETTITIKESAVFDIKLLQASVEEMKQAMVTFHKQLEENLHTSQFEQLGSISAMEETNAKVLSQLSFVMDKMATIETERKAERKKSEQEIEEIKKNQKTIVEMLQAMQNAKGRFSESWLAKFI